MNCRALFSHEKVSANSRQAFRDSPNALRQRQAQVVVKHANRAIGDDVARAGDRERRDRHAAGERLELHDAERVGQARKDKHVRRRDVRGELFARP